MPPKVLGDTNHRGQVLSFLSGVQRRSSPRGGGSSPGAVQVPPPAPGPCPPALLHLPRMWLQRGHLHQEHSEVVFLREAKPTPVFFLKW